MFALPIDDDIELQLLDQSIAPELFDLTDRHRDSLRRWLIWVDGTREVEDTRRFIRRVRKGFGEDRRIPTSIWYRGELAGCLEMFRMNADVGSGELGYWLVPPFEGKGIVTRACAGLVARAFDDLGYNRVVIRCQPENARSAAVAKRLGFTYEGTLRQCVRHGDELSDLEVYAMLRSEWRAPADAEVGGR